MKLSLKDVLKTALPLVIICVIVSGALGLTNELTRGPIAKMEAANELAARQEVLPEAKDFKAIEGTDAAFTPYEAYDGGGKLIGYIITTTGNGYGGAVRVMTGITTEGAVSGISVLSQSETVGLGANCEKQTFRDQFRQELPANGFSVYKKGSAAPEGGIEALTSATITSRAVVAAVNAAVDVYHTIVKGGN